MLLVVDVGTTNFKMGVFSDGDLVETWRFATDRKREADDYAILISTALQKGDFVPSGFKAAIMASVVPPLTPVIAESLTKAISVKPDIVTADGVPETNLLVDVPHQVGIDRVVNCVAASKYCRGPAIVVDVGTFITFDVVNGDGDYGGGAISPGPSMSAEAMFRTASQLPRIELKRPHNYIGKNTNDCMESGLYLGFLHLIDGMLKSIGDEMGSAPQIIATGGLAEVFAGDLDGIDYVLPDLTLQGLYIVHCQMTSGE
tara:strand:- start:447 stop:1220 length:774 start_codon:yes stop_codon:yes gene_type:complete